MLFVDQARITVIAGAGGRGCQAFAQPPYTRAPYADGGDGGDGGDVVLTADSNVATLLDFQFRHEYVAGRGGHGGSNTKTGKHGEDRVILVPVGTVIKAADSGETLRDLDAPGVSVIIVRGGRGGYGNAARARSARQMRTDWRNEAEAATPGGPGEERQIILELKLIADVGLIGFPNAGKSSLLARISTAKPKIAAYPFTTRYPVLGVVQVAGRGNFVACDIPGLIEGAHEGKGLGFQFLRHIERTRLLLHLVDVAGVDGRDPVQAYRQLNAELAAYQGGVLAGRPQLVVANKMDLPDAQEHLAAFEAEVRLVTGRAPWRISAATGSGIAALLQAVWHELSVLAPRPLPGLGNSGPASGSSPAQPPRAGEVGTAS